MRHIFRFKTLLVVAALALLIGCSESAIDNIVTGSDPQDSSTESVTPEECDITLYALTTATRTTLNNFDVEWCDDDELACVLGDDDELTPIKFTFDESISDEMATFKGSLTPSESMLYITYPYDAAANFTKNGDDVTYIHNQPLSQSQNYVNGEIDPNSITAYMPMCGAAEPITLSEDIISSVTLSHLSAIVDLEFVNVPYGRYIKGVVLTLGESSASKAAMNIRNSNTATDLVDSDPITITLTNNETLISQDELLSATVRVAVLPQWIYSGSEWSVEVLYDDGSSNREEEAITFTQDTKLEAGVCYSFNSIYLSEPVYPAVGDYYYADGTFSPDAITDDESNPCIGIIHYIDPSDPFSGKIVNIYHQMNIAWSTDTTSTISTGSSSVGLLDMKTISQIDGWESSYPAFYYVHELNPEGTTYSIGAEGVWYVPSFYEMCEYISATCGLELISSGESDIANGVISYEEWTETSSNSIIKEDRKSNREDFANKYSAVGGDWYQSWNVAYWCTMEESATQAWAVWLDGGNRAKKDKDTNTGGNVGVRAIQRFSKTRIRD